MIKGQRIQVGVPYIEARGSLSRVGKERPGAGLALNLSLGAHQTELIKDPELGCSLGGGNGRMGGTWVPGVQD